MEQSRIQAIKEYFNPPPVTNSELIALKKTNPEDFKWLGDESAKALGNTIKEPTGPVGFTG